MDDKKLIELAEEKAQKIISIAEEKAKKMLEDANALSDQKIKEYLFQAVQSGKSETSGIVALILSKIETHIETSINKNVNGKIINLADEFKDYVKGDMEWKSEYQPYIKGLANVSGGAKILVWVAVSVSAVIGAIVGVKNLTN